MHKLFKMLWKMYCIVTLKDFHFFSPIFPLMNFYAANKKIANVRIFIHMQTAAAAAAAPASNTQSAMRTLHNPLAINPLRLPHLTS